VWQTLPARWEDTEYWKFREGLAGISTDIPIGGSKHVNVQTMRLNGIDERPGAIRQGSVEGSTCRATIAPPLKRRPVASRQAERFDEHAHPERGTPAGSMKMTPTFAKLLDRQRRAVGQDTCLLVTSVPSTSNPGPRRSVENSAYASDLHLSVGSFNSGQRCCYCAFPKGVLRTSASSFCLATSTVGKWNRATRARQSPRRQRRSRENHLLSAGTHIPGQGKSSLPCGESWPRGRQWRRAIRVRASAFENFQFSPARQPADEPLELPPLLQETIREELSHKGSRYAQR